MEEGDQVTCKHEVEAFYSRYAGYPEQYFKPGMVGTIGHIRQGQPGPGGYPTDYCVDFEGIEYGTPEHTYTTWRCVLQRNNIQKLEA